MARAGTDMREAVMAAARATVQARGYNALSFRDLAKEVGIKSASVHYHFPTKGDLGVALAQRYTQEGEAFLAGVLADFQAAGADAGALTTAMDRYIAVFRQALANDNRMCLCGIMSAELDELPPDVRGAVDRFMHMNVDWLAHILALAWPARDPAALRAQALAIFSAIEGAQLVARGRRDITAYDQTVATYRRLGLIP